MGERSILHRGLRGEQRRPNSFEGVADTRSSAIECDVFLLADGQLAVVHNKDIGKTQEEVEAMTLKEFEQITATDRKTGESGTTHPLLPELIALAYDRGNPLLIELKASTPERTQAVARAVVESLARQLRDGVFRTAAATDNEGRAYLQEHVGLHSFSVEALEAAGKAMDQQQIQLKRGLFWPSAPERANDMAISKTILDHVGTDGDWALTGVELAQRIGVNAIDLQESTIRPDVVEAAHKHGLQVYAWVVTRHERMEELQQLGVDHLITESK